MIIKRVLEFFLGRRSFKLVSDWDLTGFIKEKKGKRKIIEYNLSDKRVWFSYYFFLFLLINTTYLIISNVY